MQKHQIPSPPAPVLSQLNQQKFQK